MFGYVKPVAAELLVKEYDFYKATYCGICRAMKSHTGFFSNVTITYDSVFLALLRMAYIDDSELSARKRRCIAHPLKRRPMLNDNSAITYTARAFAILTYYKMKDDLTDERLAKKIFVSLTRPIVGRGRKKAKLTELASVVEQKLLRIGELEKQRVGAVDDPATLFGELLGEIFRFGLEGADATVTYQCGYHLGRFIYAADAAEDYERDRASGSYNPYVISYGGEPLTYENRQTIKLGLIADCIELEKAIAFVPFENKVIAENIVKNIIYVGLTDRISFLDKKDGEEEKGK